eukprot:TRINITY_DN438_c0_g1_i4.p1 TRINITY_DN438_c0_g1~~TRINITY_DN438_c0_g1_i4.p1  ORF type:complete len:126 (+),score=38.38 TRINITY_DN438_c0_g1_i4:144-521(+)
MCIRDSEYAAKGLRGANFYNARGDLIDALTWAEVRDRAEVIGRKLVAMGYEAGDRIALIAETSANFVCFFVGCQYASVLPVLCVDTCLLYTSDAADDLLCVDLGGRRIIKKKKNLSISRETHSTN